MILEPKKYSIIDEVKAATIRISKNPDHDNYMKEKIIYINEVWIGKYLIQVEYGIDKDKVYIGKEDGESGEFSIKKLEKVIDKFYTKEF